MANDIKLQSETGTIPLDENLRPLKVGNKTTPLELSNTNVKVNNLTFSGIASGDIIGEGTFVIGTSGDLKLFSTAALPTIKFTGLFPTEGDVYVSFVNGASGNLISVKSPDDTSDSVQIQCLTNGATTIQTTDADSTDANFTLDIDGDIILDSATGAFIIKNNAAEFSVANSAYAGMILGYTTVGIDALQTSYTLSATMSVLDNAMKVKFVAPPSGAVEIFAQIYFDTARRLPVLGLSDQDRDAGYRAISFPNATDATNEHLQAMPPLSLGDTMLRPHWVVTGLTAGTAYEWWFAAKTSAGTGGVLKWGGTATNQYPPFIMKATALPTAVADYAVYG